MSDCGSVLNMKTAPSVWFLTTLLGNYSMVLQLHCDCGGVWVGQRVWRCTSETEITKTPPGHWRETQYRSPADIYLFYSSLLGVFVLWNCLLFEAAILCHCSWPFLPISSNNFSLSDGPFGISKTTRVKAGQRTCVSFPSLTRWKTFGRKFACSVK